MLENNPYSVLGVNENSSEDEIKDAYRMLAKKYHIMASNGENGAYQKMEELDRAYDDIMLLRNNGYSSNSQSRSADYVDYGSSQFSDVREKINIGRYEDAEMILDGIPSDLRTAEWYYLKGRIQQNRGWFDEAYKNYAAACSKEPQNAEYKNAFENLNNYTNGGYRQTHNKSSNSGCSSCDICTGLICADCCCECFGGDLIPCC